MFMICSSIPKIYKEVETPHKLNEVQMWRSQITPNLHEHEHVEGGIKSVSDGVSPNGAPSNRSSRSARHNMLHTPQNAKETQNLGATVEGGLGENNCVSKRMTIRATLCAIPSHLGLGFG